MKKILYMAMAGMLAMTAVSCDKNDDDSENVYYSFDVKPSNLELSYNGNALYGKAASVFVDGKAMNAAILFSGADFDLSGMVGEIQAMVPSIPSSLPTTGVFPGSATTTLEVALAADKTFSGKGDSDYCTFDYEGSLVDSVLVCNFTNVTLKDASFAGKYAPLAVEEEDSWSGEIVTVNKGFHFVWESDDSLSVDLGGFVMGPISISDMVTLGLAFAGGIDPSNEIGKHLDYVEFLADGNVRMSYKEDEEVVTTPLNVCQYVYEGNQLRAFLNPAAMLMVTSKGRSRADEEVNLDAVVKSIADYYVPMVKTGIPVQISQEGNVVDIYLNNTFMNPLFKGLGTVLAIPEIQKLISQMVASESPEMAPMIESLLPQIPGVLNNTTKFEVGLSLMKL